MYTPAVLVADLMVRLTSMCSAALLAHEFQGAVVSSALRQVSYCLILETAPLVIGLIPCHTVFSRPYMERVPLIY